MKIDWYFWVAVGVAGLSWLFFETGATPLGMFFAIVFLGMLIWNKIAALIDAYRPQPEAPLEGEGK